MPSLNKSIWLLIGLFAAAFLGVMSIIWLGQDNPAEELCEEVIKAQSGMDIDLSPATPETSK